MGAKPVVKAPTLEAIAMRHFYRIDPGIVKRFRNRLGLLNGILMTDCMATISQGYIGDVDFFHAATPSRFFCAIR
jgi:hypothetical protein